MSDHAATLPQGLAARAAAGTLAHAYVLVSPDGARREEVGRALAAAYLCAGSTPPCGQCKGCRKVERDIHPDVSHILPEPGKDLTVGQVRAMRSDVYVRPNEGARKVYVLHDAQRMNPSAQNAFLKVLEDGPDYAVFLLLVDNDAALLPTVRSRCETVRLNAAPAAEADVARQAGELAGLLLSGDRWATVRWCVPLERAKREEVVPLWQATRQALLAACSDKTAGQVVRLSLTLDEMLAAAAQNANLGALWGKLWAAQ